jgi:hypothetical protein
MHIHTFALYRSNSENSKESGNLKYNENPFILIEYIPSLKSLRIEISVGYKLRKKCP